METFLSLLRIPTLSLAISMIISGNALAYYYGKWQLSVFIFSLLTALSLQVLTNIANDYGDGIRGSDIYRPDYAPKSAISSEAISVSLIKKYIIANVIITIILGVCLLWISVETVTQLWIFSLLGIASIIAAITYTVGKYAYGYYALGEVGSFIFFGWIGVLGSYAIQQNSIQPTLWLVATGAGLLTAAVLNLNNIRDLESDARAGKKTLAQFFGFKGSCWFHVAIIIVALICYGLFAIMSLWQSALWVLALPFAYVHIFHVCQADTLEKISKEFSGCLILAVLVNILFSLGIILSV